MHRRYWLSNFDHLTGSVSVAEQISNSEGLATGGVESIANFLLYMRRQTAPLAGARDHLERDVFCGRRYQITRSELMLGDDASNWLFAKIFFYRIIIHGVIHWLPAGYEFFVILS